MYLSEHEKILWAGLESNLSHFNATRKTKITARLYVADGNRVDLAAGMIPILSGLEIETAFYCVAAINNYLEAMKK